MAAGIHDIVIEQGATFTMSATLTSDGTTPVDLTGFQGRGQVRAKSTDVASLAAFTVTVSDPVNGVVDIELPDTESSKIPVKGASYKDMATMYYDIELYDSTRVIRLLNGEASISPEITK
jgi:hypothetical protein